MLSVEALSVTAGREAVPVIEDISFEIAAGETLALVGESGSGKSVTALALLDLLPAVMGRRAGRVSLDGAPLPLGDETAMAKVRGGGIGMVFQEPSTALNPVMTIGDQVAEALVLHESVAADAAWRRAVAMLDEVGLTDPGKVALSYPHQLSGGMKQRALIAMALVAGPRVLLADEPTTALDVTVQARILDLLDRLKAERGMALLLISHDLGVVAERADRIAVMYAGRIVELLPANDLFTAARHPYTLGLLAALPQAAGRGHLAAIPGRVPPPGERPPGCAFQARCPIAQARCAEPVALRNVGEAHRLACAFDGVPA
ncbi:MAG: ABC transporter ATP-binding protein [Alphaproteobacteria bacterium]|nr:ABC transporter ATP-binding protein [Alphaproteobacteria bacterium]